MSSEDRAVRNIRGRNWLRLAGAGGVVLAIGMALVMGARPTTRLNTAVVQRGTITATIDAVGQVRSAREARLSLPAGGRVKSVLVKAGDRVEEKQVLLALDATEATRRVREAELQLQAHQQELDKTRAGPSDADIEIARANLRQATVALALAQASYDKIAGSQDAGRSAEALALENARTAEQRARAEFDRAVAGPTAEDLASLETQVKLAAIALDQARQALADTELRAPFAGMVMQVQAQRDENVGGYAPLVTLADMTRLRVRAYIDEIDVGEVAPGQEAEVRLDAFPGEVLTGRVEQISPAASTERGSTQFETLVSLLPDQTAETPSPIARFKLGMGANLKITTVEKPGVLLVPNRAVQAVGRKKVVKVLAGGQPRETEVTVGLSNGSQTEVREGLAEGQVVVVE